MQFRVAVGQIDSRVGDFEHNLQRHLEMVDEAVAGGAQLILFPELSLTGYTLKDLAWDVALNPHSDQRLAPLKERSRSISIIAGFVESASNHGIYNAAMLLEHGEVRYVHRKIYPPTYGMFEEGRYFSPGTRVQAVDSRFGRIGILVCEDFWHLSLPYLLAMDGAEVVFCLTASPTRIAGESEEMENAEVNHEHHRTYARLLSMYVIFANRVGFEDGVNFWGGSSVVAPSGEMIARAKYFSEELIFGEVNSTEVKRARRFSRHFLDENIDLVQKTLQRISRSDRHS